MPKTVYAFRGGPLDGTNVVKELRGRSPEFMDGFGERMRRTTATSLLKTRASGFYFRSKQPEIVEGNFAYIYIWSEDVVLP